jgi:uncharacterized zinc-type alcohol dehydrogenase-like protein
VCHSDIHQARGEWNNTTPTHGGYSQHVVVTERFVAKLPAGLDPAAAVPLLCAGITTYSPLRQWDCKRPGRGRRLGGLGHMAVKLADRGGNRTAIPPTGYVARDADAATLAHELGHILIDSGAHISLVNPADNSNVMMAPRELQGGMNITLDRTQCSLIFTNTSRL